MTEDRVSLLENQISEVLDAMEQLAKDLELAESNINRAVKNLRPEKPAAGSNPTQESAVQELTFTTLKFDAQKGAKIGDYEVAYQASNLADKWSSAFNVLQKSNATIQNRYLGPGYEYSYWLYGENKIYRQKLKPKS
jgi:hypothetical protein